MPKNKNGPPPQDGKDETEDQRLWAALARTVAPLAGHPGPVPAPKKTDPKKTALQGKSPPDRPWTKAPFAPGLPPATTAAEPARSKDGAGPDRRTAERLRRGQIRIEARLDLHGLHQGPAQEAVLRFIQDSALSGRRCVLVITGKGTEKEGVLRRLVPVWLGRPPLAARILAVVPARARDGGEGALYVLLRRRR